MTKSTAAYTNTLALTGAAYGAWQGVLSAQLNAVLSRTADTGQMAALHQNTTPVAATRDYEVFRFADSLQATAPIFIKINWAMDGTTFNFMNVTVGTSTNGAGTLGGVTVGPLNMYAYTPTAGGTRYVYASSDGSQVVFVAHLQAVAQTSGDSIAAFVVERTRDADGTPNATGYMVYHFRASSDAPTAQSLPQSPFLSIYPRLNDVNAVQPPTSYDFGVTAPNLANATSYLIGSTAYAFPAYGYNTALTGASKAIMLGFGNDFPKDTPVALSHYGTTMTFLPLPQVAVGAAYMGAQTTASVKALCPLLRWE